MRQGLLSEPQASSGPAAMLLAVSRSPSSIPDGVPARSDATFLWRPSTTSTHKTSKTPPTASTPRTDATSLWRPSPSQQKKRHPAVPTLPDTETKTPVKQTYTIYNQHSLSAQLNYHQKVLSATQDRWPAL